MSPKRRAALTLVWVFYFGVLLNSWFGPLRLTPYVLNYLFVLAVLCIPFLRTPLTDGKPLMDFVSAEAGRAFTQVNVILIAILIAPIALANLYQVTTGDNISLILYKDVRRFQYNRHVYHVIYTNMGATDDGAVLVTRETSVVPFMIWVSQVYGASGCGDVEILQLDKSGFWIRGNSRVAVPEFVADPRSR
ncbi:MAG: hypothetical protein V4671_00400 [Armatimonadota bacterium]